MNQLPVVTRQSLIEMQVCVPKTSILIGDVRQQLKLLPGGSVHCCITSPPYWSLRDYGTGTWEGGDAACDHVKGEMRYRINLAKSHVSTSGGAKKCAEVGDIPYGNVCGKCGAKRIDMQLGLEDTLEEYIANMVDVFREVRRVLRPHGTLWVNIGSSYASKTMESEEMVLRGDLTAEETAYVFSELSDFFKRKAVSALQDADAPAEQNVP